MDGQIKDLFKQAQSRNDVTYFVEEFTFSKKEDTLRLLGISLDKEISPLRIQWPLSLDITELSGPDLDLVLSLSEDRYGAKFFRTKEVFLNVLIDMRETLSPFGKIILFLDKKKGEKKIFLMRSFGPNSTALTLEQFRFYSKIFQYSPLAIGYKLSPMSLEEWFAEKHQIDIGELNSKK